MPVNSPTPSKQPPNFSQEDANYVVDSSIDTGKSGSFRPQSGYQADHGYHLQEEPWVLPCIDFYTSPERNLDPYFQPDATAYFQSLVDITSLVGLHENWPNVYSSEKSFPRTPLPVFPTAVFSSVPNYSDINTSEYNCAPGFPLEMGCSFSSSNFPQLRKSDGVLDILKSALLDPPIPTNAISQTHKATTTTSGASSQIDETSYETSHVPIQPQPTIENKPLSEVEEAFSKFVPLLSTVTAHNVSEFLTECMKEYHRYVSLDDLYNLLFGDISDSALASSAEGLSIQKHESFGSKFNGIDFCRLIIDTFRGPHDSQTLEKRSSQVYSVPIVNFHELLRTFLGIKILCILVLTDQDKDVLSSGCPAFTKSSLYKGYYIICQKLFQKYSSCLCRGIKDIIVSPAKLGRLTNLLYPNLVQKRIGRRGESKPHYLGLNWNYDIVDKKMLGMLDLEIPHLEDYFNTIKAKRELNVSCLGHTMS
ncbi:hypothetical protein JCM33374_g3921 [Metschnikowia sp. JCM 33374]|nr:hypothetical protein JCM33374_g3921 [Metschnikowia sp. JCM 33374]